MRIDPEATTAGSMTADVYWAPEHDPHAPKPEPPGPLSRLQFGLFDRTWWGSDWLGNRVSDLRYWLWRLCK